MAPEKGPKSGTLGSVLADFALSKARNTALIRASKPIGNSMIAYGSYLVNNPNAYHTQTLVARYTATAGMTANEMAISESRHRNFVEIDERHIKKEGYKGPPKKKERFSYTRELTRADRTPLGRVRVSKKGGDFLQTIEDFEQREKRLSRERTKGRAVILGGAAVRFGVPVMIYGSVAFGVLAGAYHHEQGILESNRLHDAFGPMALPFTIAADTAVMTYDLFDIFNQTRASAAVSSGGWSMLI